ncbi:MAG: helix-turn-helix transcriptional regulator [Acidobacteria bacterium]|nr:helix-turn-helix transcriptional regulator [Patescibacteria group bacterium]MBU4268513.1 helix-turn-helix transcriptional regulator [Acidobacteriota bacterium]MBU4307441.1 helix-turn-helix transcriptional regulator [Acidobacteriota bacterium]
MNKTIFKKTHRIMIDRLIQAREEAGMTQVATARLLGKTQSYISKMESGQRRVDTCQLIEFAQIYRKDLSFFLPI